jgi:hypothetical protein|tara:strand:- start:5172 stop:5366 length:195 start_codon:yes stop_codon:yes gene_type:complete
MLYKAIITKKSKGSINSGFDLLINVKEYARKHSLPNDRVRIYEIDNFDPGSSRILYDYIVEDWS